MEVSFVKVTSLCFTVLFNNLCCWNIPFIKSYYKKNSLSFYWVYFGADFSFYCYKRIIFKGQSIDLHTQKLVVHILTKMSASLRLNLRWYCTRKLYLKVFPFAQHKVVAQKFVKAHYLINKWKSKYKSM